VDLGTARKAVVSAVLFLAGAVGIKLAPEAVDWWIAFAFVIGEAIVVYWTKNKPGTLTGASSDLPKVPD
jgi:predicted alpha/beta hydrolase